MRIVRKSLISGIDHVMDIPVTLAQIMAWNAGIHIQDAMPNLTAAQREFIMTGITEEEWNQEFGEGSASAKAMEEVSQEHELRNYQHPNDDDASNDDESSECQE